MTEQLERLTTEVRKLTATELDELRLWLAEYWMEAAPSMRDQEAPVDWSDLFERVKAIRQDAPPLQENIVLVLREEEEY